jgi:large subunit ribosomal protein L10e
MGDGKASYTHRLDLISDSSLQIRDNAIESARQVTLRRLEKHLGKIGYYFQVRIFPHHVLRENPLASGAGADRMSTGMKMSFGKPIGIAAQVRKGQTIFSVSCSKATVDQCKEALHLAGTKFPCHCRIVEHTLA